MPKPATKANRARRRAERAPTKAKASKKAVPSRKAHTWRTEAKIAKPIARDGSKTAEMLNRPPRGVTAATLMKRRAVKRILREFPLGTVGKKLGWVRSYSVKP